MIIYAGSGGQAGVLTNLAGLPNQLPIGQYKTTQPVLLDGNGVPLQEDPRGNLRVVTMNFPQAFDDGRQVVWTGNRPILDATSAWSKTSSAAAGNAVAGVQIKGSAGRLRRLDVANFNTTTGFFMQVFDATALPTSTVTLCTTRVWVPPKSTDLAGVASNFLDFGVEGLWCATGIVIAASSTPDVFTVLAGKDSHTMALWG